jgi:hypothetical protein
MSNEKSGQARRPGKREVVKVPSPLLRKARMLAASKGVAVQDYLESVLRPVLERDYEGIFDKKPEGDGGA